MTHPYQIQITLSDGSQQLHDGLFIDGFDAVLFALDNFPNAKRIFPRRLPMMTKSRACDDECHVACNCPPQSRYPFAPGVIEGPTPKEAPGDFFLETVVALVCLGAVLALVGLVMGYFSLPGVLP